MLITILETFSGINKKYLKERLDDYKDDDNLSDLIDEALIKINE